MRLTLSLLATILIPMSAALAQETVSVPLPGAEVNSGELKLNGDIGLGTNLARDYTILSRPS